MDEGKQPEVADVQANAASHRIPKGHVATLSLTLDRVLGAERAPAAGREPITDERLARELEGHSEAVSHRLTEEIEGVLGPAFRAELASARPSASVDVVVLLHAAYTTVLPAPLAIQRRAVLGAAVRTVASFLQDAYGAVASIYADWDVVIEEGETAPAKTAWESMTPVLGAIAGGIGVLGFVTFIGGAIEFARLDAAGLPAEEAVAVVPTQNLVVIGAGALVPAIGVAFAATAALFVWFVRVGTLERIRHTAKRRARAVAGILFVSEFVAYIVLAGNGLVEGVSFLVLTGFTVTITYHLALITERFVWLAVPTFLSLGVFLIGLNVVHAYDSEEVRPAAVLRDGDAAFIGFFVAHTGDRVYLARLDFNQRGTEFDRDRSRIVVFENDQITDVAFGPLMEPERALTRASDLARELCRYQIRREQRAGTEESPSNGDASPKTPNCWDGKPAGEHPSNP
jgi:hypothetical protein